MSDGNICFIYSSDRSYPLKRQVSHTSGNFVSRSTIMFGFIKLQHVFHLCKFYYWSKVSTALAMSDSSSNNPVVAVFIITDMYTLLCTQYVRAKR